MNKIIIFLLMIFLHIVDDYYLQGWLASAKQKKWWEENAPDELYKYDYIWALIMHSFSWTFMVMLPVMLFSPYKNIPIYYLGIFIPNMIIHAYTDHNKANLKKINLWEDQIIHLFQIVLIFIAFFLVG